MTKKNHYLNFAASHIPTHLLARLPSPLPQILDKLSKLLLDILYRLPSLKSRHKLLALAWGLIASEVRYFYQLPQHRRQYKQEYLLALYWDTAE
ncbi:MAG: hypothetical protein MUE44_27105 [Oscillatoriaceae cyanobacterium Prado104]|nr:hypothetical protein [Oscillatoriaceae cyanobacterium Prado104]